MAVPVTAAGFRRGLRAGLPLALSVFVCGLGFGLVAVQASFSLIEAALASAAIYSGSAQLAAVNLIRSGGATSATSAAAILVVNARYVLFGAARRGAALRPWRGQTTPLRAWGSLLLPGDGTWLVTMRAILAGERDRAFLLGTGAPMFVAWLAGTMPGVGAVSVPPAPQAPGFDLMLAAFAAAMMTMMVKGPSSLVPLAVGAGAALAVGWLAGPGWGIVAAGLAGGLVAALLPVARDA
jgi:predicted branched-subunit amino acid permease